MPAPKRQRIFAAHLVRRRVDTARPRGIYVMLLRLAERAEQSRDALMEEAEDEAAANGVKIFALANLPSRGLNMLRPA
jgi:hypothetical protein